ncbi:serine hydrolase [Flammeovirgaceae bacterium SG7u.111]|nr:serine hydrolase [Flammeovirgaceae bacterium SG7u.132]WPO37296.1 serine hydrolase [Flammeovirgaceae bacterium SG7u.111]
MKISIRKMMLLGSVLALIMSFTLAPYPIDGYEYTGIRRLLRLELIMKDELKDAKPPLGAQKSMADIKLNLVGSRGDSLDVLPAVDPAFQKAVSGVFSGLDASYSLAITEITKDKPLRFMKLQEKRGYQPGSVGKLAVLTGFFHQIAKIYPKSYASRIELMKTKQVRGGRWVLTDSHTIPVYDIETKKLTKRIAKEDDVFSLFEWIDHMLSVSNNGAASVVWREVMLMDAFGEKYPELTDDEANEYFKNTPKKDLSDIATRVVNQPLRDLCIDEQEWKLGSFFTYGASNIVPDKGGSIGTVIGLMKYLVAVERGKVIDQESSLEIKRLMYMTDRRIRYASAPALSTAAVYFKSGSLYQCREEEGYNCQKYMGNKSNFMNSVAIIEHENGTTYLVCLMSNVLKRNSSSDHLALATSIDRIMQK